MTAPETPTAVPSSRIFFGLTADKSVIKKFNVSSSATGILREKAPARNARTLSDTDGILKIAVGVFRSPEDVSLCA